MLVCLTSELPIDPLVLGAYNLNIRLTSLTHRVGQEHATAPNRGKIHIQLCGPHRARGEGLNGVMNGIIEWGQGHATAPNRLERFTFSYAGRIPDGMRGQTA